MKRKIYDELIAWKNLKSDKMPLVLYGARQIGKTWVLQEFGKNNYKNTIYVNFERELNSIPTSFAPSMLRNEIPSFPS